MQYIAIFESLTKAKVKDCIANDIADSKIFFIVHENEMGKAIGRHGSNIKRIESILKKRIRLVEFSNDILQFVKNLIYPLQAKELKEENGIITIYCLDTKTRGIIIGRDRNHLNFITNVVKRHFEVKEVKVA